MKTALHSLLALALVSLAACSHSPTASKTRSEMEAGTKTGMVKNIVIKETIVPDALTVRAGDEVRWINQRQDSVTVLQECRPCRILQVIAFDTHSTEAWCATVLGRPPVCARGLTGY